MFVASVDFGAIHASTAGIPAMMVLVWAAFLLIPGAVLSAGFLAGLVRRIFPSPVVPAYEVRTAKNGRLYACIPGAFGVTWARKGEAVAELLARVSS